MKVFAPTLRALIVCAAALCLPAPFYAQLPTQNPVNNPISRPDRRGNNPIRVESSDPIGEDLDRSQEAGYRPVSRMQKAIKEKLRITDEEKTNYKRAVNDSKANIIRLLSAFSCSTALVVDLSDPRCADNPLFFAGSYYSFRYKDYGESAWTDLNLIEEEFTAGNKWNTVGLIVDLGEAADFSKLDENSKEIKELWDLPSAETLEEKTEQKTKLEKGFIYEEVFVSSKARLLPNHTYLLRTIGYRVDGGFSMFSNAFNWHNTDSLFVLKALDFQEQRATIAWKKLMQRVAPMLREKEKSP